MVAATFNSLLVSESLAIGTVVVFLVFWLVRFPLVLLSILPFSLVIGQVGRVPLPGQGGGLLVSDPIVAMLVLSALVATNLKNRHLWQKSVLQLVLLITLFLAVAIAPLAINLNSLALSQQSLALAYWLRLAAHLLLIPALITLTVGQSARQVLKISTLVSIILLTTLGFIQLAVAPSLQQFAQYGWDPHQGRLVATWLDPNFIGVFLAIAALAVGASFWPDNPQQKKWVTNLGVVAVFIIMLALIATKSRSSLLALAIVAIPLSPLLLIRLISLHVTDKIRTIVVVNSVVVLAVIGGATLQDRLIGLVIPDATVNLRVDSLRAAWPLATEHTMLGVGYNAYQFTAHEAGLINSFTQHSRAGTDNSWLNLWITTGIPGLLLFLLPWIFVANRLVRLRNRRHNPYVAATILALMVLALHANSVNSVLYGHLMIFLAILIALAWTEVIPDSKRTLSAKT